MRAGVIPGKLLLGGAPEPVEDAAVLFAQVDGPFEEYRAAFQPAFHLDAVLVGVPRFPLERGMPQPAAAILDDAPDLLPPRPARDRCIGGVRRLPLADPNPIDARLPLRSGRRHARSALA